MTTTTTEATVIQLSDVITAVRELAGEYPDAVYQHRPCQYTTGRVSGGCPHKGCLIGQALRKVEPGIEDWLMSWGSNDNPLDGASISGLIYETDKHEHPYRFEGTGEQKSWLGAVQGGQDEGNRWGECVSYWDRRLATLTQPTHLHTGRR